VYAVNAVNPMANAKLTTFSVASCFSIDFILLSFSKDLTLRYW
jgi:hypothetical protein